MYFFVAFIQCGLTFLPEWAHYSWYLGQSRSIHHLDIPCSAAIMVLAAHIHVFIVRKILVELFHFGNFCGVSFFTPPVSFYYRFRSTRFGCPPIALAICRLIKTVVTPIAFEFRVTFGGTINAPEPFQVKANST
jgi:uncharacterized membrane protein